MRNDLFFQKFMSPDDGGNGGVTTETETKPVETENKPDETEEKHVELSAEEKLQQLMLDNAKLKKAQEKAASEAADYKKKYNATLSDVERASQEKAEKEAERQEQFEAVMKENKITKLEKNYLSLGYPEDKATEAATAMYEGDTDTLHKLESEVREMLIKRKEAEWLKSRPPVSSGAGDGNADDPFLKGFNS